MQVSAHQAPPRQCSGLTRSREQRLRSMRIFCSMQVTASRAHLPPTLVVSNRNACIKLTPRAASVPESSFIAERWDSIAYLAYRSPSPVLCATAEATLIQRVSQGPRGSLVKSFLHCRKRRRLEERQRRYPGAATTRAIRRRVDSGWSGPCNVSRVFRYRRPVACCTPPRDCRRTSLRGRCPLLSSSSSSSSVPSLPSAHINTHPLSGPSANQPSNKTLCSNHHHHPTL